MEKKNAVVVAICGVILVAFLAVATVKILQMRETPPAEPEKETVAEVEPPEPERRHGPRVRRKVDIGSTFSNMAPVQQNNTDGKPKELHEQTPEEAVESAWQALDTYREQSPEDRAKTQFALSIINGILNGISANATRLAEGMNEQQRAQTIERGKAALENLNAIEQEVIPDMNEEELQTLGSTVQALHNLTTSFMNAVQ